MASRSIAIVLCALGTLASLAPSAASQGAGVDYALYIRCPLPDGTQVSTSGSPPGTCPVRAIDPSDLMGDPSLAVDPLSPENLIIASLHGQNDPGQGPSARSRQGQVFTTFTSQDAGATWVDNPYYPPDDFRNEPFGEHPQVTIDPYGHVFVGSMYAEPNGTAWDYVIGAQKFESIDTIDEEQFASDGSYNVQYITPVHHGNQLDQFWFLFNPITDNMTMVWHESIPRPANPPCETDSAYILGEAGFYVKADPRPDAAVYRESNGMPDLQTEATCIANPDARFILAPAATPGAPQAPATAGAAGLLGAQSALPQAPAASTYVRAPALAAQQTNASDPGRRSAIGVAWTTAAMGTPYYYQDLEDTIQPCAASTNPVLSFGFLYVGCVVDTGEGEFRWDPNVPNGTVYLFRMDPDGGAPEPMGRAPPMDGTPRLGVRSDGRIALVSASAEEGRLELSSAFGRYEPAAARIVWGQQLHLGDELAPPQPGIRYRAAAVQDVIYREQSGAVHLILKATIEYVGQGVDDILDGAGLLPHIQKQVVALSEDHGLLATLPLNIGDIAERSKDATIMNAAEAAFQDLSDDFLQLPSEPGLVFNGIDLGDLYQREFFAVGDYGTVIFAEIIEVTEIRAQGFPPPPAPPTPVPAPAATNLAAPVAGLLGAGSLLGTLAIHRRKSPLAAFTKG